MFTLADFFHKLESCQLSKVKTAHEFEIWNFESNLFNTDTKGAGMSVPVM